jgi:hypothetical protein
MRRSVERTVMETDTPTTEGGYPDEGGTRGAYSVSYTPFNTFTQKNFLGSANNSTVSRELGSWVVGLCPI